MISRVDGSFTGTGPVVLLSSRSGLARRSGLSLVRSSCMRFHIQNGLRTGYNQLAGKHSQRCKIPQEREALILTRCVSSG